MFNFGKKSVAFLTAVVLIMSSIALVPSFAEELGILAEDNENISIDESSSKDISSDVLNGEENVAETARVDDTVENVIQFSCRYDTETRRVKVSGSMKHDAFAVHKGYSLDIFAVPLGVSEYDAATAPGAKPLAQTAASIKFEFVFNADRIADRYSRYAIFLHAPDGKLTLAANAQYPEVKYEGYGREMGFKGAVLPTASAIDSLISGTVILPIYMDELFTDKSNGYIYRIEDRQFFFDRAVVDRLDASVNSAVARGASVYLRFLARNGGVFGIYDADGDYILPNVYDPDVVTLVHGSVDFITARYNGEGTNSGISGIIVGKGIDDPLHCNACDASNLEEYEEMCGAYISLVTNAARSIDPSIDVVIPFLGNDTDSGAEDMKSPVSYMTMSQAVLRYFEETFESGIDCTFLFESSDVPFGITSENIAAGIDVYNVGSGLCAGTQRQKKLGNYIHSLSSKYKKAPSSYIFLWNCPETLSGGALSAAYAYSYYALASDPAVSSFVISIDDGKRADKFSDIAMLMKYIGTSEAESVTKGPLSYFGKESWTEISGITAVSSNEKKDIYNAPTLSKLPRGVKGSFSYLDFSSSVMTDGWLRGMGCGEIKIDYVQALQKALRAELSLKKGESGELIYRYEYGENITYTPYLKFELQIKSEKGADALYGVSVRIGNENICAVSNSVVRGNELSAVIIDISETDILERMDRISLTVRRLNSVDGENEKCTLWFYGMTGHSMTYTSEELQALISSDRSKTKNDTEAVAKDNLFRNIIIASSVIFLTGLVGLVAFKVIKKEDVSTVE